MVDISHQPGLVKKLNMFSPTLLVFNHHQRWNGPITKKIIDQIAKGRLPQRKPYAVKDSAHFVKGAAFPLTEKTVPDTYLPCGCTEKTCCTAKADWINKVRNQFALPHLGILHYLEENCVGGAEFVPSILVPYSVPKAEDIAFLTCSFLSDQRADYKSLPLQILEDQLPKYGFKTLIAIVSEEVVFPNGPLQWFIDRGYEDLGNIHYEKYDQAKMHLIQKKLKPIKYQA